MLKQTLLALYGTSSLEDLIGHFQLTYYNAISAASTQARERLNELMVADTHRLLQAFYPLSQSSLDAVDSYVTSFETQLIPYALELSQKAQSGHNCAQCSGNCDMGHRALLIQLHHGHQQLHRSMYELQQGALPLYSNLEYPAVYSLLRDELHGIQSRISDLVYLEESILIPRLLDSQKMINAHYS